jgi:hypothetical protein
MQRPTKNFHGGRGCPDSREVSTATLCVIVIRNSPALALIAYLVRPKRSASILCEVERVPEQFLFHHFHRIRRRTWQKTSYPTCVTIYSKQ